MLQPIIKYRLLFYLIFLFCYGTTAAQDKKHSLGVEGTYHYGLILPHHKTILGRIITGHTQVTEISIFKVTNGGKNWQQHYKYPKLGFSFMLLNLANEEELGNSFGTFPFIEFPLNEKKIKWRLRAGYGIGYVEKPFDKKTNYQNLAIGSKLNALIYFNMQWQKEFFQRWNASAGLSLTHLSNASYTRPNLGINVASLNFGLSYGFGKQKTPIVEDLPSKQKTWTPYISSSFGIKEIEPFEGPKYIISSTSFNLLKTTNSKSRFGFGTDLFYNPTLPVLLNKDSITTTSIDNFRIGITAIYALDIGKLSCQFQMGFYPYTKYKKEGYLFHRILTRYLISNKLFIHLGLKTHFAVADFFELGIGLKLK